jgi:tetratricopeptide (TPR) repeat protein
MKNVAQMMESAAAQHRAGKLAEAERAYNEVLAVDQGHTGALGLLGALYMQLGQFDRAMTTLERALKSDPSNPDTLNNLGCLLMRQQDVAAAKAHFEKAMRAKPDYPQAHYNLGNVLRTQGKINDAIAHYETALRLRPQYPEALFQLGQALRAEGRLDEAIAAYEKALIGEPNHPRLLHHLGNLLREKGEPQAAIIRYDAALRLKPDYAEALVNYGTALRDTGKLDEAMAKYQEALRLAPLVPDVHINIGTLLHHQGRMKDAIASYDTALRFQPDNGDAQWNKAIAQLALGNYREGWPLYESGLDVKGKRGKLMFKAKRWDGRPFQDKRLLIWGEQGLGDTLQFVRYAKLCKARGGKVIVMCVPSLARLIRTNPFVDEVVTAATESDFDFQASLMSLPYIFGTSLETVPADIPYLSVTKDATEKWAKRFDGADGFKVGLVWAGSSREGDAISALIDKRRSLHLSELKPLLDTKGVRFYSLQLGAAAAQITELGLQDKIADFTSDISDFMDTAAIIDRLDLVISVDTSTAHLAGALGKPLFVLSRFDACWRWLQNRESNPWYPQARIFGQPKAGDWDSVIQQVHTALGSAIEKPLSS